MAGVMGIVVFLSFAAMVVAGYLLAHHRARAAADLAAVSGAAAFLAGGDACDQARATASANGARAVSCEQVGDQIDFVVSVRVSVAVRGPRGLPRSVEAAAHAGPAA